jgi:hypothetical protein
MIDVVKQKKSPSVIEIGSAGRAFRVTARRRSVRHKPWKENRIKVGENGVQFKLTIKIATNVLMVEFQSPYELAFPTNTE